DFRHKPIGDAWRILRLLSAVPISPYLPLPPNLSTMTGGAKRAREVYGFSIDLQCLVSTEMEQR
ncbi:hypothetical protein BaRGS_00039029, partial [Batillaria attramentaria]